MPTGSGKSLTFYITQFVIDFFKHGKRGDIVTVCLVIFLLVSLMNDLVSSKCTTEQSSLLDASSGIIGGKYSAAATNLTVTEQSKAKTKMLPLN